MNSVPVIRRVNYKKIVCYDISRVKYGRDITEYMFARLLGTVFKMGRVKKAAD